MAFGRHACAAFLLAPFLLASSFAPGLAEPSAGDSAAASCLPCSAEVRRIHDLVSAYYFAEAETLARACVSQALEDCAPDSPRMAEAYLLLAETLWFQRLPARVEARHLLDRVARMDSACALDFGLRAKWLRTRGIMSFWDAEVMEARQCYDSSARILEASGGAETLDYASTLALIGLYHVSRAETQEADSFLTRALAIFKSHPEANPDSISECEGNLAFTRMQQGRYADMLQMQLTCLFGIEARLGRDAPRLARPYYQLVPAYLALGRLPEARHAAEELVRVTSNRKDVSRIATGYSHYALAGAAWAQKDYTVAIAAYGRALSDFLEERSPGHPHVLRAQGNLMSLLVDAGRPEEAIALAERMDPYVRKGPHDATWQSQLFLTLEYIRGRSEMRLGNPVSACKRMQWSLALQDSLGIGDSEERPRLDAQVALAAWLVGDVDGTLRSGLASERRAQRHLYEAALGLSSEDAFSFGVHGRDGLGIALTALLGHTTAQDSLGPIYDAVVRSRGLVLEATTARLRALAAAPDPETSALLDSLAHFSAEFARAAYARAPFRSGSRIAHVEARRYELRARLVERLQGVLGDSQRLKIGQVEILRTLGAKATLVSSVRFARRREAAGSGRDLDQKDVSYAAFVAEGASRKLRVVDLGPAARLDAQLARWARQANLQSAERTALGDSLRRAVWEPLRLSTDGLERLYVVPDGPLTLLSLAALPAEGGGYLAEQLPPVVYLAAERDLVPRDGAPHSKSSGLLAVGNPDFQKAADPQLAGLRWRTSDTAEHPVAMAEPMASRTYRSGPSACLDFRDLEFEPLPFTAAEVGEVASLAGRGGVPVAVLDRAEAGEAAFKRFAPGRSLVHVASHGFFVGSQCNPDDTRNESPLLRAGLALAGANDRSQVGPGAEDGVLTAEEVSVMRLLGTECVVLSACETGIGDPRSGEGLIGLRWAFHAAGVRSLVTSLWKVDDAATRAWMREFYTALWESDADPAVACHQASLAMLRKLRVSGQDPDPALWAGFVVSGR
jgi:CHAT domain-containing protein/tetratricopeptide (TPR) repeat protein